MYGLTRYWLEGTNLHYITSYGGENTVPLTRIDIAKTLQLNAERSTPFDATRTFPNPYLIAVPPADSADLRCGDQHSYANSIPGLRLCFRARMVGRPVRYIGDT